MRSGEHRITVLAPGKPAGRDRPADLVIDVEGADNRNEITRIGVKGDDD
jgi:hypothetical protein